MKILTVHCIPLYFYPRSVPKSKIWRGRSFGKTEQMSMPVHCQDQKTDLFNFLLKNINYHFIINITVIAVK